MRSQRILDSTRVVMTPASDGNVGRLVSHLRERRVSSTCAGLRARGKEIGHVPDPLGPRIFLELVGMTGFDPPSRG